MVQSVYISIYIPVGSVKKGTHYTRKSLISENIFFRDKPEFYFYFFKNKKYFTPVQLGLKSELKTTAIIKSTLKKQETNNEKIYLLIIPCNNVYVQL